MGFGFLQKNIQQRFLVVRLVMALFCLTLFVAPAWAQSKRSLPGFEETLNIYNYGDDQNAYKNFQRLAMAGDERAQFYLATMLEAGQGVGKDIFGAINWYLKSAKQEYPPAMAYVGYLYSSGIGVTKNDAEAFKWYTKAAQAGEASAQAGLATMLREGRGYKKDYGLAIQWYLQAAQQGHARAQYYLATMYRLGQGVKANDEEAMRWYNESSSRGDMYAQNFMGSIYRTGRGVEKDPAVALEWYRRSAEQGHTPSQVALASMYEVGEGDDTKGPDDALIWYGRAAKKGNPVAQYKLAYYSEKAADFKSAVRLYERAASEGNYAPAITALGRLYEEGKGTKQDSEKAYFLYKKCAETGDFYCQVELGRLYKEGKGVAKDPVQAYKWLALAAQSLPDGEDRASVVVSRIELANGMTEEQLVEARKQVSSWTPTAPPQKTR